jgi:predicted transcriptional regulator
VPGVVKKQWTQCDQLKLRKQVWQLCHLRGKSQVDAAKLLNLTPARICQVYSEVRGEFEERIKDRFDPLAMLAKKLEQYEDIRDEAWDAWIKSKEDARCTVEEEELKIVFEGRVVDGKVVRVPIGEKMVLAQRVTKIAGRLPDNAYLSTIIKCLVEEARLEGLTQEAVVKITNNSVAGNVTFISWDPLVNPTSKETAPPDLVELALSAASAPLSPIIMGPDNSVPGGWSEAEKRELDDEPEHLNGDGV